MNNVSKLPTREITERAKEYGLTQYSFDEIFETANEADAVNSQWLQIVSKAQKYAIKATDCFSYSEEEQSRLASINELCDKYYEVSIFGAKGSKDSYPVKQAQRNIKKLQTGIKKMTKLSQYLKATYPNVRTWQKGKLVK